MTRPPEEEIRGMRGEFISGPHDGTPAMLNGYYNGLVVVLVCDYSGCFMHVPFEKIYTLFKRLPDDSPTA